jgi:purine-cytosine permease-like protein
MIFGAAIGGAVPNIPSWTSAYETGSVGGIFAAMLTPASDFGKFITVLLSLSTLGNMAATIYSVTLNFQVLTPALARVPRPLFSVVIIAIVIPLSMYAAVSFFDSLHNFVGVIGYWSAAVVAVLIVEHLVFRSGRYTSYDPALWNVGSKLPTGVAALGATALSFALVVPCIAQTWFVGPIAKVTGDIGFEVAFALSAVLYVPLRRIEIKWRGGLQ